MSAAVTARALILVNESSGWGSKEGVPERLAAQCAAAGFLPEVRVVRQGVNCTEVCRDALAQGARLVIAGGGDGTLRAVAESLVGTDAAMGILPVGTLNHLARDLHLPLDPEEAAQVAFNGQAKPIDVGEVNDRVFINNAIIGLYPAYRFYRAEQERRGHQGFWTIVWAWLTVLRVYPFLTVRLRVGGQEQVHRTPYILVANNRHAMQGYRLGTRESLTEGELWVYVMRRQGRLGLVRMALSLVLGRFRAEDDFEVFPASEFTVETRRRKLAVSLDGEIVSFPTPLRFRSRPRSLRVVVPRQG